jgi:hypothetical protein
MQHHEGFACPGGSIVFLGDIVGYGGSPAECVDLVRKLGGACVMGNHDVEIGNPDGFPPLSPPVQTEAL